MSEQLESVNCAVCERADTVVFSRRANAPQFVRCRHDELVYMNPRPTRDSIRQFEFVRDNNLELFDRYRRKALAREALAIKAIKAGGALLDVGCATGTLFENFEGGNWRLAGVEPSALAAEQARSRFGADVFCGTLNEAEFAQSRFDVVTILDTLYYTADPLRELEAARRALKSDGVLAVEIPGFLYSVLRERGPLCWLVDGRWSRGFTDSRHLYYFSPESLRALLARAGFRIVRRLPEPGPNARGRFGRVLGELHFALGRILFRATAGRVSIAAKELYLAVKEA